MGLLRGMARTAVVAGTATAVSNRVSRRQERRWADKDEAQYQEEAAAASAPDDNPEVAEIQKYAQLRDQGILTEEEFAAKKKQILGL